MHEDEVHIDGALVRRLLAAQLPQHAGLPLTQVEAWGTDHAIFRLGSELSVRVPKIGWAAAQGEKEARWLPELASRVAPVSVPVPLEVGEPTDEYPYQWYVSPWLAGETPRPDDAAWSATVDRVRLARDLAAFVVALQRVEAPPGAPAAGPGRRGGLLAGADVSTRDRAAQMRAEPSLFPPDLDGRRAVEVLLAVWDDGMNAPAWDGAAVWLHGDLSDGNVLMHHGRLSGVIDWGLLVAGDPAPDVMPAWNLFDAPSRAAYRDALGFVDDATWRRARAWAVCLAIQAIPYYRDTNPDIVARSWRVIRAVMAEVGDGQG
jgi:aminoglycoside phosphotransferase (APT) family kinase protein